MYIMQATNKLLNKGFESSSGTTPEFALFFRVFKKDFTKELMSIGATNIVFNKGHFSITGFFTVDAQTMYFSMSDVREISYARTTNPFTCFNKLMYRTAKDYKDFSGGQNLYVYIEEGMAENMNIYCTH